MPADDNDLVERARHGDVDAYGELVRHHQDQALAAAYVILGDRQEAEDAVQEAFTNAYLALDRFRPGASFRPWLLRIVINEARDLFAARQRRVDVLSRMAGAAGVPSGGSAEAAALAQRRREALLMALFELPETDRLVITCRYFLDLSEAEIADVLGVARGTVKSRLSRALERLGPILHDLGPLVVVPPVVDLPHLVGQHIGSVSAPAAKGVVSPLLLKLQARAQHVATFAAASLAAVLIGSVVMMSRGRSAPSPAPPPPPPSIVVMGADLSDAERQEVATRLGTSTITETVTRPELADALRIQGVPLQSSDEALSSVQLTCGAPGSGLTVSTRNIGRLTPAEYAGALIVAGRGDGSVIVAGPSDQAVSGETAVVGLMKAVPTCAGGQPADSRRVGLAYQELALVSAMAGADSGLPGASAAFLDVLNATVSGQAPDTRSVGSALDSAAAGRGITLDDATRDQVVAYFDQLRGLNFGAYSHGLVVQQPSETEIRIAPVQSS